VVQKPQFIFAMVLLQAKSQLWAIAQYEPRKIHPDDDSTISYNTRAIAHARRRLMQSILLASLSGALLGSSL
jgi:hypothetical protein